MPAMASNWNTKMAWEYHEATKHSTRAFAPTHISWTGLTSQCRSNFIPRWSGCVCPAKYAQPESPLCLRSPKAFPLTQWRYPMLLLVQLRGGGIAGGRKYFKILRNKSPRLDHYSTPLAGLRLAERLA